MNGDVTPVLDSSAPRSNARSYKCSTVYFQIEILRLCNGSGFKELLQRITCFTSSAGFKPIFRFEKNVENSFELIRNYENLTNLFIFTKFKEVLKS